MQRRGDCLDIVIQISAHTMLAAGGLFGRDRLEHTIPQSGILGLLNPNFCMMYVHVVFVFVLP